MRGVCPTSQNGRMRSATPPDGCYFLGDRRGGTAFRNDRFWSGEPGRGQLIDRIDQQAILDLSDVNVAKVIDQIPPGIVQPPDSRDERDHTADFQSAGINPPSANQ